jgi:hypothetical protein
MSILPPEVTDPSPHLYDSTLYAMSSLLAVAVVCNSLIGPVNSKHYLPSGPLTSPSPNSSLSSSQVKFAEFKELDEVESTNQGTISKTKDVS